MRPPHLFVCLCFDLRLHLGHHELVGINHDRSCLSRTRLQRTEQSQCSAISSCQTQRRQRLQKAPSSSLRFVLKQCDLFVRHLRLIDY